MQFCRSVTAFLLSSLLLPALVFSTDLQAPTENDVEVFAEEGKAFITVQDDRLTVQLHEASWAVVFQELQRQTNITFRVYESPEGTVTEAFTALPLENGLGKLLRNTNFILLYQQKTREGRSAESRLAQVWILSKKKEAATETTQPSQQPLPAGSRHAEGSQDAVESLITEALTAEQWDAREKAIETLIQHRDPRVRDVVTQALQDPDEDVRATAVESLAKFNDQTTMDHLKRVLSEDPDEDVRETAAEVLEQLTGQESDD